VRVILRHTAKIVAASGGRGGSIISLATLYLQNHIGQSINVVQIARAARTSPAYLGRTFAGALGTSPTHFAVLMKMEIAKRKLSLTDDSVAEIGRTVGYEDPFYFSRLFRRVTGMSPRGFRERAKAESTPSRAR
jgi:AraC-like DNA-binding protein